MIFLVLHFQLECGFLSPPPPQYLMGVENLISSWSIMSEFAVVWSLENTVAIPQVPFDRFAVQTKAWSNHWCIVDLQLSAVVLNPAGRKIDGVTRGPLHLSKVAAWSSGDHSNGLLLTCNQKDGSHNSSAMDTTPRVDFKAGLMVSIKSFVVVLARPIHDDVSLPYRSSDLTSMYFSRGITWNSWCKITAHEALLHSGQYPCHVRIHCPSDIAL
jgi:hypothetical protein